MNFSTWDDATVTINHLLQSLASPTTLSASLEQPSITDLNSCLLPPFTEPPLASYGDLITSADSSMQGLSDATSQGGPQIFGDMPAISSLQNYNEWHSASQFELHGSPPRHDASATHEPQGQDRHCFPNATPPLLLPTTISTLLELPSTTDPSLFLQPPFAGPQLAAYGDLVTAGDIAMSGSPDAINQDISQPSGDALVRSNIQNPSDGCSVAQFHDPSLSKCAYVAPAN